MARGRKTRIMMSRGGGLGFSELAKFTGTRSLRLAGPRRSSRHCQPGPDNVRLAVDLTTSIRFPPSPTASLYFAAASWHSAAQKAAVISRDLTGSASAGTVTGGGPGSESRPRRVEFKVDTKAADIMIDAQTRIVTGINLRPE